MSFGLAFWILMLIWLLLSLRTNWPLGPDTYYGFGGALLSFILFGILGWHAFGPPIHQ